MILNGKDLTISDVHRIAMEGEKVELSSEQLELVKGAYTRVQQWGNERYPIYGVNTGFGEMIRVVIPPHKKTELQVHLVRTHAAGGGPLFSDEVVRSIIAVRLNCLMKGYAGISVEGVEILREFLNREIYPLIPEQGSLGASGDLAPLAHIALAVIGEGYVRHKGEKMKTADAFAMYGIKPLVPGFKEALALINGTSAMTGLGALALVRANHLLRLAIAISADVTQCLNASTRPFDHLGNALKNHPGQTAVAAAMRSLLAGSGLMRDHANIMNTMRSHLDGDDVVDTKTYLQNAYSLRCIPQVLGMVMESLQFCQRIVEEEANSCNDNPLIFNAPEECFHGANFHGQYVAMACDYLNIALTEIGVLAERQLNRLVDPHLNTNLVPFLAHERTGLFMGFQGAQYLATSIASENLDLCAPASVKSIPSNGQNQDIVSMGLISARKSWKLTENIASILGVTLAACRQASHLVGPDKFSAPVRELHDLLPALKEPYRDDTLIYEEIAKIREFVMSKEASAFVEAHVPLKVDASAQPA